MCSKFSSLQRASNTTLCYLKRALSEKSHSLSKIVQKSAHFESNRPQLRDRIESVDITQYMQCPSRRGRFIFSILDRDLPQPDVAPPHSLNARGFAFLANCLVKGQLAFDNVTHGGRSLEVLRAASAYKSSPGPCQCVSPPGIVCEVHLWQVVKDWNNDVKGAFFFFFPPRPPSDCKERPTDTVNLFTVNKRRSSGVWNHGEVHSLLQMAQQ